MLLTAVLLLLLLTALVPILARPQLILAQQGPGLVGTDALCSGPLAEEHA